MRPPTIKSIQALENYQLLVEFANHEYRLYDLTPRLSTEVFAPLQNPVFFQSVKVDTGGYAAVWNEEIDLSEHELWIHGQPWASANVPIGQLRFKGGRG